MEDDKQSEEIPEDINIEPDEHENENVNEAKNDYHNINSNSNSNKASISNKKKSPEKREKSKSTNPNKKSNQNAKNKNMIQKKKPFLVTENKTEPYKKVKITINACSFLDEYLMPIWCPKNVYIKFLVEGKWRIDKKYEYTDSKGLKSNNSKGFNYGALIGRIGKKINNKTDENEKEKEKEKKKVNTFVRDNTFVIANEFTYLVKEEGPLFLRANLPKKMKIEPEGKLEVSIYDADYMDISEINEKIGWIENDINLINNNEDNNNNNENNKKSPNKNKGNISKEPNDKEIENNIRNNINNLRMNPSMYYEKYISFNANYLWTKEFLEKKKSEYRDPLQDDEKIYNFLADYIKSPNQEKLRKDLNINKNIISDKLKKMSEDLSFFIKDLIDFSKTVKVKCKITQKDNPIDIIVQYLLDKQFRPSIFNSYSKALVIKIRKNFLNNSTLVIMAIILDRDNVLLEEPGSV